MTPASSSRESLVSPSANPRLADSSSDGVHQETHQSQTQGPFSSADEIEAFFREAPFPELLAFLNGMLHRRMLVHRDVTMLLSLAVTKGNPQSSHLAISADSATEETVIRNAISALQSRLSQIQKEAHS